ncbi:hypothetical protein B484DRAFT_455369 [Ochromonadaceae sp. CCMP2298]|nr:hypothetical protein B484DRAFT_455369 [Ochromonadaceae sp. CCMP2298]
MDDTYIRLFLGGTQVAFNDDVGGGQRCSEIDYIFTEATCETLELRLGCFGGKDCKITATVVITPGP